MNRKKIILRVVLTICILAVVVFAVAIVRELYIDGQSRSFYSDLSAGVETRLDGTGLPASGNALPLHPDDADYVWSPYVDFDSLNLIYPGIVAWIKLEETVLDYPVMQYTDNERFMTHLPDGTWHRSGSIFLDYRNGSDFSDKSILIYGHETRNHDMFGVLKNYRNQEFYDENPVVYLYTPHKDYKIVLFAGHLAHSQRDHPPLEFKDDEEFLKYVGHLKSISLFDSDVPISADDRIVSLCTCAYDFDEARLVIVGVLVEC